MSNGKAEFCCKNTGKYGIIIVKHFGERTEGDMRERKIKRWNIVIVVFAAVCLLTACGMGSGSGNMGYDDEKQEIEKITLYPFDENLSSGVISGHKGDYFAKNGIQLEVLGYSEEKTKAILASGNMPDIMYVDKKNLDNMIERGMLLNLDDYIDKMPHVKSSEIIKTALEFVREYRSSGTGNLYGLPLNVGDNGTKISKTDSTERYAVKLNWDIYEEIGAPEIKDFGELIDVMEQMVNAHPKAEDGTPCYGTVLNGGSDKECWANIRQFYFWQGYSDKELPYLLEANMAEGSCSSILSRKSIYYQGLKWYNEVYRRGLMDSESINNDRNTQAQKVQNGYVMIPSGTCAGWAPEYLEYYIPDTKVYYNYYNKYGDEDKVIAINAQTEHLDACLKLLDMWCDADAYFEIINGPDGEFWESDGENAFLTKKYYDYLKKNNGSGQGRTFSNGEDGSLWNTAFCINTGEENKWLDGEGGHRVGRMTQWKEVMELATDNETYNSWKKTTGYETWIDWLEAEDAYVSEGKLDYVELFCTVPDSEMQIKIDKIKNIVVDASWKMVYAESEEEFEGIWEKMVYDVENSGGQAVIEWRLAELEKAQKARDNLKK